MNFASKGLRSMAQQEVNPFDKFVGSVVRQATLVGKASKESAQHEQSVNAQLLTRAGFVSRLMAGVYSYLPLGTRVLSKIENVIRQEMNAFGAAETLMPALQPKEIWSQTGRWDTVDVLFKFKGSGDRDMTLGPTHEEVVTPLIQSLVRSFRDLPVSVFQIQTKFRNEARAKSGLLRGREFRMKDLYSFHSDQAELDGYYDRVAEAYRRIFDRCGIGSKTFYTAASGGVFSKYSHEFQTITPHGEDTIYTVPGTKLAINREIVQDAEALAEILPQGITAADLIEDKAIEVGNIFKLGTRFSDAFDFRVASSSGASIPVFMGCYGLGSSRLMGTVVEVLSDERGMVWPQEIAPFDVHLISLAQSKEEIDYVETLANLLSKAGLEVLLDDRDLRAGEKFAESDLIGIPNRLVVSKKSMQSGGAELKKRAEQSTLILPPQSIVAALA
jgi:prolyl-tRNA synthetase